MRLGWILAAAAAIAPAPAGAGTFSILTYNVAGLPQGLSSSSPLANTPQISPLLNAYDMVLVQEDFAYHDPLVASITHPYQSVKDETPGPWGELLGYAFGDGLNTFSRTPFSDFTRVTWGACFGTSTNGSDCLTPKGFSVARHELEPGVFVDVYNLHADAGGAEEDLAARRANLRQLYAFIADHSADSAVLVLGDTNSRYTRGGDAMSELVAAVGLTDVWAELVTGGVLPPVGPAHTAGCDADPAGAGCERIDKILYRNGGGVIFEPLEYGVPANFVDAQGAPLSDHLPVSAVFSVRLVPEPGTALLVACGLLGLAASDVTRGRTRDGSDPDRARRA